MTFCCALACELTRVWKLLRRGYLRPTSSCRCVTQAMESTAATDASPFPVPKGNGRAASSFKKKVHTILLIPYKKGLGRYNGRYQQILGVTACNVGESKALPTVCRSPQ
jgi:hypothetical protein